MFQKPTFGNNTSGFGSFSTSSSSPFGGFKPTASTSAFGAPPAFGANATSQPTTGGGLFGATNTTGGLFGTPTASTSAPAFGGTTNSFGGFGASTSSGGLFSNNTSTGLFGGTAQNTSAFGAKPAGFGFGNTPATGTQASGLFGASSSTGTTLFGQPNTSMSVGGLFTNTTGTGAFGQQQTATGTAHVKYNPVGGTDLIVKSGTSQNINIKHQCITCMKEYETKSLEELRLEDYLAGRKGSTGGMFGGFQQPTENKPLFGGSTFGQPATTSASGVFGGGTLGGTTSGFGQPSTFSFGGTTPASTNTTGLFGAAKPTFGATATTGTGLFGATTTPAPAFGTSTSTFGFGSNTQTQQTGGLFGAKPTTSGFGAPATSSTFGGFGSGVFGAKTTQAAPAFGTTAPAFGSLGGAFGSNTSGGGAFASNTFGKPAVSAAQPTFGFSAQPQGLGTGLGTGLGGNTFQAKPAAPAFGNMGSMLFQPTTQNNAFKTGMEGGLGGGLFSNTSTLGGTSGLGAFNTNTSLMATNNLSGASAAGNVHEQILALAARPYGDSPLFKDLLPDSSTTAEDVLKPTNPAAVKAVLDNSSSYRISPSAARITLQPVPSLAYNKKSLFEGLEESDSTLEDKLTLKPSRKRLVLRPKQKLNESQNDSLDAQVNTTVNNRSLEYPSPSEVNGMSTEKQKDASESNIRQENEVNKNHLESNSERQESWLSSTNLPWNDKAKSTDGEPVQKLYPDLDKEISAQISDRRASWLTTKPLRKQFSNTDSAENSVRELGLRADRMVHNKENIDDLCISEEENVPPREVPPHPTGVKLTRAGYYTIPSLDDMINYMKPDGTCVVPHLTIGRINYGNVYYDCEIDVAGMDLDALVHFLNKEVIVYPDDDKKPPVGEGLNRRAVVTLDRVWPRDKTQRRPITDPERLLKMDYEGKLRRVCDKHDTKFIEYRPQTGSWVFRVEHFSKYGLTDSDEDDEITPEILKKQLINQALQTSASSVAPMPATVPAAGLGGLAGLGGMDVPASTGLMTDRSLFSMHHSSLNIHNGTEKTFDMDITEDNNESQSLYQDSQRAHGVKSPTSELAHMDFRRSHNVQLMKSTLDVDTEMVEEERVSVSPGDQLVPQPAAKDSVSTSTSAPSRSHPMREFVQPQEQAEAKMPPLIVQPKTIVLKYHRKVIPFKRTIAGNLDAACISDMSICRARHSRVGFGPSGAMVYVTSYNSIAQLSKQAELSSVGAYVAGRGADDYSEPVLTLVALPRPEEPSLLESFASQLEMLLEHSVFSPPTTTSTCHRASVKCEPSERLALLRKYVKHNRRYKDPAFGVSASYCDEVWRLCEALWGADLENEGAPDTVESLVNRHKRLIEWFQSAVSKVTDEELAKPRECEVEDESDGHSFQVWTLVLGGRLLDACRLARSHNDYNMAAIIAHAAGDMTFRSLIQRQLTLWNECGALEHMAASRIDVLRLLCGDSAPLYMDWLRAVHATARYICPPVPRLEQIIRKYERFFFTEPKENEEIDLSIISEEETGMTYPVPPYIDEYDAKVTLNGKQKRVLDLRYLLVRARAYNTRPAIQPATYTPDPFDYSLCFLLGTWFGNPTVESITGFAHQLEAYGAWHLAVQVLTYHPDEKARAKLIRAVLSRHAPCRAAPKQLAWLQRLQVPAAWLLLAQAHRAKYHRLFVLEAEHLINAEEWNAAHRVLMEDIFPNAALTDNLQSVWPLAEKLNVAAAKDLVAGWKCGGAALYHYSRLRDQIGSAEDEYLAYDEGATTNELGEAQRADLAAACTALAHFAPKTREGVAARTYLGARLARLLASEANIAAGGASAAASLLQAMKLPSDCIAPALQQITTDLAERASELCIETSAVSPPSSRQRIQGAAW